MIFHKHRWGGAGWSSDKHEPYIDKDCFGLYFTCDCGKRVCVMEPTAHMKARYKDERIPYPQPYGEFRTVLVKSESVKE